MKKTLFFLALCFIAFSVAPHVFAQSSGPFVPLSRIPGLTDIQPTQGGLADFFNNLYKYLIGVAATLAVIEIIWGGLEYSTQDSVSKKSDGKQRIYQAIFGLVLVLSPVLVFSIINPSILNLSIDLPPITMATSSPATTLGPNPGPAAPTGCTVSGTLLKTAICDTQKEAQDFAAACPDNLGGVPFFTTQHKATCGSKAGPYSFADDSSGIISTLVGYSHYQPLVSTSADPNNGNDVVQFGKQCTADGGTTCLSTLQPPCASTLITLITTGKKVSCWNISLSCTDGQTGAGGCSSNPDFAPVQGQ